MIKFLQIRLFPSIRLPPFLTAGNLVALPFALHVLFYGSIIASCSILKLREAPRHFGQMDPIEIAAPALGVLRNSTEKKAIDV